MVHETLSAPASYSDSTLSEPVDLTVRWSNKLALNGDLGDYANVIEGVDRLIFNRPELVDKGVTLRRGGRISIPSQDVVFELDTKPPGNGPVHVYWLVTNATG